MKPRLFCLGDSFVDWHTPKFHWTYYLEKHYELYKYGKYGADNYTIISQLGILSDYKEGDRILIIFTDPGRLPRRFYGERKESFINDPYTTPNSYKDNKFAQKLNILRVDEEDRWTNGNRENEVKFLRNLKKWLLIYDPVFITWSEQFYKPTSDFVNFIKVTSNCEEGVGEIIDFHPGPKGCYDMYKEIHNYLNIKESIVDFENEIIENKMI